MPIKTRKCVDCGRRYDVVSFGQAHSNGAWIGMDTEVGDLGCPTCDCVEFTEVVSGRFRSKLRNKGFDYSGFDRGLGTWVEDAAHRDRLCKFYPDVIPGPDGRPVPHPRAGQRREERLIPLDGQGDVRETFAAMHERRRKDDEMAAEIEREMTEGPNKEAYGKAQEYLAKTGTELWKEELDA